MASSHQSDSPWLTSGCCRPGPGTCPGTHERPSLRPNLSTYPSSHPIYPLAPSTNNARGQAHHCEIPQHCLPTWPPNPKRRVVCDPQQRADQPPCAHRQPPAPGAVLAACHRQAVGNHQQPLAARGAWGALGMHLQRGDAQSKYRLQTLDQPCHHDYLLVPALSCAAAVHQRAHRMPLCRAGLVEALLLPAVAAAQYTHMLAGSQALVVPQAPSCCQ